MHRGGDRISGGDGIMRPDTPAALFAKLGLSVCRPAHADHTFAAVSSRGTRTFLVPVDSNVLATASLTLHNGLRPPPMRVMRRVLGTAFRAGLAGPLLRAGGRVVGVTRGPENLLDVIEHRLGVSHLTFAATTGVARELVATSEPSLVRVLVPDSMRASLNEINTEPVEPSSVVAGNVLDRNLVLPPGAKWPDGRAPNVAVRFQPKTSRDP